MSAAKYPRRAVAFGPPFDDGTVPEPKPRRRMKQASPSNGAWPPTSEAMPHRPTSRTPDDTAQDNGARALAEAMAYAMPDWRDRPSYVHGWMTAFRAIERILANGAAFLPDAAELDRLRRIEARYKRLQSAHHRMLRVTAVTCTACKIERAGGSARDGG